MTESTIAIYGATGYTGRLVAAELISRGHRVILSGRDADALTAAAREIPGPEPAPTHPAALDDAGALRALAEQAAVLIHCAGPFSVTGDPVAAAAAAAGRHYIDHALEPHHVKHLFDTYQDSARRSGATMVPGLSFYGGFGDLLASAAAGHLPDVERIIAAYAVTGWRMTSGAKQTAEQLFADTRRITYSDGALNIGYLEPRNAVFAFPPPVGPRTTIVPLPTFETLTVPRHTPARNVDLMITARTFEEEQVFTSENVSADLRAQSGFTVAVQVDAHPHGAAAHVTGRDLWRAAALASVEGAVRLARGQGPGGGVFSPAEAFPATSLLRELEKLGAFTFHLRTPEE